MNLKDLMDYESARPQWKADKEQKRIELIQLLRKPTPEESTLSYLLSQQAEDEENDLLGSFLQSAPEDSWGSLKLAAWGQHPSVFPEYNKLLEKASRKLGWILNEATVVFNEYDVTLGDRPELTEAYDMIDNATDMIQIAKVTVKLEDFALLHGGVITWSPLLQAGRLHFKEEENGYPLEAYFIKTY